MFSCKRFGVLALIFKSMIHFDLIINMINIILLHMDIQLSQHHLLKRLFSPALNSLGTIINNQLTIDMKVYIWTLNSIPLIYVSTLMPVSHVLVSVDL